MRLRKYVFPRLASERIKLDGDCHCQSIFDKFVASFYRLNPVNLCRKMIGQSHNPYVSARIFQRNPVHFAYRSRPFSTKYFSNRYRSVNHVSRRKTAACRRSPSLTNQGRTVKPTEKALATLSPKGADRAGCTPSQDSRTAPRAARRHPRRGDPPCFSMSRYRRRHA